MTYAVKNAGTWHPSVVEDTQGCNFFHLPSPMTLVAGGIPAIAYRAADGGTDTLRYAVCQSGCNTGTGPTWAIQTVFSDVNGLAFFASIATDPNGLPAIAFTDEAPVTLGFATCSNDGGTCATATGTWSVGFPLPERFNLSLAFSPVTGTPAISGVNPATGNVNLMVCASNCDSGASSVWDRTGVAGPFAAPFDLDFTALKFDAAGNARIAYYLPGAGTLSYVVQTDAGFTGYLLDGNVSDGHVSFVLAPPGTDFAYSNTNALEYAPSGL